MRIYHRTATQQLAGYWEKLFFSCLMSIALIACSETDSGPDQSSNPPGTSPVRTNSLTGGSDQGSVANVEASSSLFADELVDQAVMDIVHRRWTGDLDELENRRVIRVLTVYGLGRYFLDGPVEKGLTYETLKRFEKFINERLGRKHLKVNMVFIPVARDELIPGLIEGRGDIAAAALTITPERAKLIDFTTPISRNLSEVLVTGPSSPPISQIEGLAGQLVYVRASSSYRASLDRLNRRFIEEGRDEIILEDASEVLEDEDMLEMVNAGLLPWLVVDDYKAKNWAGVFKNLTVREDLVVRQTGQIAYAIRKHSPLLMEALNDFNKTHRQGTLLGNIMINRWLKDFDWAAHALDADDYRRFQDLQGLFRKYGERYSFDYLIVAAQGYQESRLDQSKRSSSGAIGIMQLLPSTASDSNVDIPDIGNADSNIHAGVKYLDFIRKRYFSDPEIDLFNQTIFALAAYNAGPARVQKLRIKAAKHGYNPNVWFDHVEIMAATDIGSETVQYVGNILKYYLAYRLSVAQQARRATERDLHKLN